ncbi:MAG: L-2,4-diaminobutyrate decarboxylase [Flavobacteriales bacterium]|jgi:L-2,4-diaminobutyrate decarboxylase
MSLIAKAYDIEHYKQLAEETLHVLMANYQQQLSDNHKTSNTIDANELLEQYKTKEKWSFSELLAETVDKSMQLHNPNYMGHQVSAPLPMAILFDWVAAHFNNGMAVYEMGQVGTVAEQLVIEKLSKWLKLPNTTNGILTNGGTVGNLTALLAAKKKANTNKRLALLVSKEAHYSITRAAYIMGLTPEDIYYIPTNKLFQVDAAQLETTHQQAVSDNKHVFAICANACSTSTGAYDPIDEMANFAISKNTWFHIDGAHGGAVAISDSYAHLTKGINKANSIVIDFHKMLLCPALITAVLYKNEGDSFLPFEQKAAYLLSEEPEWENLAMRTMECTKYMMSLKALAIMDVYGKSMFTEFIERQYHLTLTCADLIQKSPVFELALTPQSNILCFRYRCKEPNIVNPIIRKELLDDGTFYIVKTEIKGDYYLRCTFMNPFTTITHFTNLLQKITAMVKTIRP